MAVLFDFRHLSTSVLSERCMLISSGQRVGRRAGVYSLPHYLAQLNQLYARTTLEPVLRPAGARAFNPAAH